MSKVSGEQGNKGDPEEKFRNETLGDFTTTPRVIPISALAMVIGVICAFVALALLRLIGLFTNLFYFGRWSTSLVSPAGNHLGIFAVLVPVAGALIIGVMARYGSERIRGHGIPEAIEVDSAQRQPRSSQRSPCSSRFRRRFRSGPAGRSEPKGRSS